MASVRVVQVAWDRMIRDVSRSRLPENAVWYMSDLIPNDIGAPLEKRGGWTYGHSDTSWGTAGDPIGVNAIAYTDFTGGARLWGVATGTSGGGQVKFIGTPNPGTALNGGWPSNTPVENPPLFRNAAIITNWDGTFTPQSYDGANAPAYLTGSPPAGSRSTVYKDLLVLARSAALPQRVWFSAPGNKDSWNTTSAYVDTSAPVTALYALRDSILIFHIGFLERIIGSIAPPGGDMSLRHVAELGLVEARTLAGTDEYVCFANTTGAYMTDGSAPVDLTLLGGIKSYWQELIRSVPGTLRLAGGITRGYYIVSVYSDNGGTDFTFIACLACHLETRRWFPLTNVKAACFAHRVSGVDELYFGTYGGVQRMNQLGSIWEPSATNYTDDDGTAILPTVETRYYPAGISKSRLKKVHLWYELVDTIGANPSLAVSYLTGSPEATSYTAVTDMAGSAYPLTETTEMTQTSRFVGESGYGVAFKLAQAGNSDATRIYQLGLETMLREASRVA